MSESVDFNEVWARHEAVAEQMVDLIRGSEDPGLEGVSNQLTQLSLSVEHPAMLACILAEQVANLLDTYMHDIGEPKVE
jgi:hypothetical protein